MDRIHTQRAAQQTDTEELKESESNQEIAVHEDQLAVTHQNQLAEMDSARLDLQMYNGTQLYRKDFDGMQMALVPPHTFSEGSKAYNLVEKLHNLISKHRALAVQLENKAIEFGSALQNLFADLANLGQKISSVISDSRSMIKQEFFEQDLKLIEKAQQAFEKDIKAFSKTYLSADDENELRQAVSGVNLMIPPELSLTFFDYEREYYLATVGKDQLIQDYLLEMNKGMEQIITLQFDSDTALTQAEYIQGEVDYLTSQIELKSQNLETLEESLTQKKSDFSEYYVKMTTKSTEQQELLVKNSLESTKQMQTMLDHATQLVDSQIQELGKIEVKETPFHYIFVLDESGSMTSFFSDVKAAFKMFVDAARKTSSDHLVSVVMFGSKARVTIQARQITEELSIDPQGGGTDFEDAFKKTEYCLSLTPQTHVPAIVFMTDGEASYSSSVQILDKAFKKNTKLLMFCIGFGREVDDKAMEALCKAGNGDRLARDICGSSIGMIYNSLSGQDLILAFQKISSLFNGKAHNQHKKIEEIQKKRDEVLQNMSTDSDRINGITQKNRQAIDQQFKKIQESYKQSQKEGESIVEEEIQKLKQEIQQFKSDLKTNIDEQARLKLLSAVKLDQKRTVEAEFGEQEEEKSKEQVTFNNQNQTRSNSNGESQQNVETNDQASLDGTTGDQMDRLQGSNQASTQIVVSPVDNKQQANRRAQLKQMISELVDNSSHAQTRLDHKKKMQDNLLQLGIVTDDPNILLDIKRISLRLQSIVEERVRYQLVFAGYLKRIDHACSTLRTRLFNLVGGMLIINETIIQEMQNMLDSYSIKHSPDTLIRCFLETFFRQEREFEEILPFLCQHMTQPGQFNSLTDAEVELSQRQEFKDDVIEATFALNIQKIRAEIKDIRKAIKEYEGELKQATEEYSKIPYANKEERAEAQERLKSIKENKRDAEADKKQNEKSILQEKDEAKIVTRVYSAYVRVKDFIKTQVEAAMQQDLKEQLKGNFTGVVTHQINHLMFVNAHVQSLTDNGQDGQEGYPSQLRAITNLS